MALTFQGERALLSLSDRTGAVELASGLVAAGLEVVASTGTARALKEAGLDVRSVEEVTGFPEILGGRVKTLHPVIHGGILMRDEERDREELLAIGGKPIRVVAVSLYPFEGSVGRPTAERVELIDIGGVALLRAAAKNWSRVLVLSHPDQYPLALQMIAQGRLDPVLLRRLAKEAFLRTATYDLAIASFLAEEDGAASFPALFGRVWEKERDLRYGENPHSPAAWYVAKDASPSLRVVHAGRDGVSSNNLADAEAAGALLHDLRQGTEEPAAVIVKHAMPSGAAYGQDLAAALTGALDADREAAFGGVLALTAPPDDATLALLQDWFFEALVLPGTDVPPPLAALLEQKPRLRLFSFEPQEGLRLRLMGGGLSLEAPAGTATLPSAAEAYPERRRELTLAWRTVAHARSNAIVLVRGNRTVGIGQGQVSRVRAAEEAIRQAGASAKGAVLASDGFFPFPDVVERAAVAGVALVLAPAGSRNDDAVRARAEELGLSLIFADRRYFRH
jgi:phosphoribosylaminoimidazolecarboxamide formyltransferase/IMP cyclohydrolase